MSIFQKVYDSEINFQVSTFWDGGFTIKMGDEMNGFKDKLGATVDTWEEVEPALHDLAIKHYPGSKYAINAKVVGGF